MGSGKKAPKKQGAAAPVPAGEAPQTQAAPAPAGLAGLVSGLPSTAAGIKTLHLAAQQASAAELQASKAQVIAYLASVSPVELKKAALIAGFKYPSLAGSTDGGKCGSLAFWLNPVYTSPSALEKKAKVQATIAAKFAALPPEEQQKILAQEAVWAAELKAQGINVQLAPDLEMPPVEVVDEEELALRVAAVKQAAEKILADPLSGGITYVDVVALHDALSALARAHVPGADPAWLKQQKAFSLVGDLIAKAPGWTKGALLVQMAAVAAEKAGVPKEGVASLPLSGLVALFDPQADPQLKQAAKELALEKVQVVDAVRAAVKAVEDLTQDLPPEAEDLSQPTVPKEPALKLEWLATAKAAAEKLIWAEGEYAKHVTQTTCQSWPHLKWFTGIPAPITFINASGALQAKAKAVVASLDAKALRQAAQTLAGLSEEEAKVATKAQLAAVVLGAVLGKAATPKVQGKAQGMLAKIHAKIQTTPKLPPVPKPGPEPPPVPPPPQGHVPAPPAALLPKHVPFREKVQALAGIVLQRLALAKMPPWKGRDAVRKLALTHEGPATALGGVHEKHFYRDPTGKRWLFKLDKHPGAPAAAAEEAAEVVRRAGLPTVEVRVRDLGDRVGSLQPMLEGAKPLPPDPLQWTPQQRQGMMMHHVVDWLLGDHDGNPQNFLVYEGAPVRVDRGQAFKFFGRDRLALDYEPNKVHGAPPHAALLLYRAARAGKVHVDPRTVLPVIKAVETIPDDEYREFLRPVAEAGAKGRAAGWYEAMAQRAAAKKGGAPVTDVDVAEAFLEAALERKRNLRRDFEEFFSAVFGGRFRFADPSATKAG